MCGINGINWEDEETVKKMNKKIKHRGPDDEGTIKEKKVTLGHVRLSIIDLTKAGHQPMSYDKKTGASSKKHNKKNINKTKITITFNGEIYNHKEIKKELEKKGYKFTTKTDTEIILASYQEWGTKCVNKFNGMWAFCIHDKKKNKLFLSRDRIGIKPLYYYKNKNKFAFSSEIKGLQEITKLKINMNNLDEFMTFRTNLRGKTIYKGIRILEAGHNMIYDLNNDSFTIEQYWDIPNKRKKDTINAKKLLEDIQKTIERRCVADVKVGTYLSGGVDSSLITTLTSKKLKYLCNAFNATYPEKESSEEYWAEKVVKNKKMRFKKIIITKEEYWNKLIDCVWYNDQPLGFPASPLQFILAKNAKKEMSIALSGEGADELFGGYVRHRGHSEFPKITSIIPFKTLIYRMLKAISIITKNNVQLHNYLFSENISLALELTQFHKFQKRKAYGERLKPFIKDGVSYFKEEFKKNKHKSLNKMLYLEFKTYLQNLLHKQDRMNMAWAVEARVPFLDHELVEKYFNIPKKYKVRKNINKYILKKAAEPILPKELIYRKKEGFLMPFEQWAKPPYFEKLFNNSEIIKRGYLNREFVKRSYEKNNFERTFMFVNLEIWYQLFIMGIDRKELKKELG